MPKFTTEFKIFVLIAVLIAALAGLLYNQFALSEGIANVSDRVEVLELHPTVPVTPEPTASPSATPVPTKLPLKLVSPSPTKGGE